MRPSTPCTSSCAASWEGSATPPARVSSRGEGGAGHSSQRRGRIREAARGVGTSGGKGGSCLCAPPPPGQHVSTEVSHVCARAGRPCVVQGGQGV